MKVAILGRTEILYDTTLLLQKMGYEIGCIITSKEAPEYSRTSKDFEALANSLNCPFLHSSNIEKVLYSIVSSLYLTFLILINT